MNNEIIKFVNGELDSSTVAKFATVQKEGSRNIKREIDDFELEEFTK